MAMHDALPMPDVPGGTIPNGAGAQVTAVAAFAASMSGYVPVILALLPAIYYLLLIWESKTVQGWVTARRARKAELNLAKLKAQTLVVGAKIEAAAEVAVAQVQAAAKVDNAAVDADKLVANVAAGVTGPHA